MFMKVFVFGFALLLFLNDIYAQEKELDSLANVCHTLADSSKIKTATDLIYELAKNEKYDTGLSYSDKFITLAKKIKYTRGVGKVFVEKANIFNVTDKSNDALKIYDSSEVYFKKSNYRRGIAVVNNNKAIIEHRLGNLESSIELLLKASLFYEELRDSISLADTFNNMGNIYKALELPKEAKVSYKKAIEIKRKNKLKNLASSLNNLAFTHIDVKEIDSAITILKESEEESKRQNDDRSLAGVHIALGKIYLDKENYKKSKEHYEASMLIGGKIEFDSRYVIIQHALAHIAINTQKWDDAEIYLNNARLKSKKLNFNKHLLANYDYAAQLDSIRGNYSAAAEWKKKKAEILKQND